MILTYYIKTEVVMIGSTHFLRTTQYLLGIPISRKDEQMKVNSFNEKVVIAA
jgi:hypothetical protein